MSLIFSLTSNTGWTTAANVLAFVGSAVLFCAVIPPLVEVIKTKKTFGVDKNLLMFSIGSGFSFFVVGLFLAISGSAVAMGIAMAIVNLWCMCINAFLFFTKMNNLKAAENENMTEIDHWYSLYGDLVNASPVEEVKTTSKSTSKSKTPVSDSTVE